MWSVEAAKTPSCPDTIWIFLSISCFFLFFYLSVWLTLFLSLSSIHLLVHFSLFNTAVAFFVVLFNKKQSVLLLRKQTKKKSQYIDPTNRKCSGFLELLSYFCNCVHHYHQQMHLKMFTKFTDSHSGSTLSQLRPQFACEMRDCYWHFTFTSQQSGLDNLITRYRSMLIAFP